MNSFLILTNTDKDENLTISNKIANYIKEHGGKSEIICDPSFDSNNGTIKHELISDVECVIVLGGDGTILRAARVIGEYDVKLVGVNLGTLGFLTEIELYTVYDDINRLLCNDFNVEERMMIRGFVNGIEQEALNDIVVSRAGFSRIIGLNIYVNNELLDSFEADGIIVSTPTGSTGYNLSAGGPIISPMTKVIAVTPISSHSLTAKTIIFSSTDEIEIEVIKKRKTQETEAIVSFDGDNHIELSAGDRVKISVAKRVIKFIKMHDTNFYKILRSKIGG